jgi:SSS family solute:Na+ symporter
VSALDWAVLLASLAFVVGYGVWKSRSTRSLEGFVLAHREAPWWAVAMAVMATQASAITFLSTPGQAYADGMRFVQFYFGLPIAMVILCVTAVPIYRRLGVFTAYEYLGRRFDAKTRSLATLLFLVQRGLAAGLTIYAPAIILSVLLGVNIHLTNIVLGGLVVIYTVTGGASAVNHTQRQQFVIMFAGMAIAFVMIASSLPREVGLGGGLEVAGALGRLNAVTFGFDWQDRFNFWSGLLGGLFVALSYFGTDQSQVGRYLTGASVAHSRLGLLFNGLAKLPMQFGILLLGALVFVFYQFHEPPVHFNPVQLQELRAGPQAASLAEIERRHHRAFEAKRDHARDVADAAARGDATAERDAAAALRAAAAEQDAVRGEVRALVKARDPRANDRDTDYVFLSFVLAHLPIGVVGLVLAAILAASMSSTAAELSALASTTVVDVWKRLPWVSRDPRHDVHVSRVATLMWGAFAIAFAEWASRLGSLIEAVNILGSLVYGTILGIFLVAFWMKRVGGTAVFAAALLSEVVVVACFRSLDVAWLWYNLIGCGLTLVLAPLFARLWPSRRETAAA